MYALCAVLDWSKATLPAGEPGSYLDCVQAFSRFIFTTSKVQAVRGVVEVLALVCAGGGWVAD